jgi:hypothetical protein
MISAARHGACASGKTASIHIHTRASARSDRQQLATLIEQLDTPDGAAGTSADDVKPDVVNGGDTLPLMTVTNSEHTFIDTFQANIPEPVRARGGRVDLPNNNTETE